MPKHGPTPRAAVLAFAKAPVPGTVKTRLLPHLTPEAAAALYTAFLEDTLAALATLEVPLRVYVAPSDVPFPHGLVPRGATLHLQRGDGLGLRMAHALAEAFRDGIERPVVVGTDHPTLPPDFVRLAIEELAPRTPAAPARVVLGPSTDGGYYLVGMSELVLDLFHGATYGHARVFEEALARAFGAGADVTVLPPCDDVDTPEDLERLVRALRELPPSVAPATRKMLAKLRMT